jgi:hypothetical protein
VNEREAFEAGYDSAMNRLERKEMEIEALRAELSASRKEAEDYRLALEEYGQHSRDCILSFHEAGEPTEDGGYRVKYKGQWYKTRPVDETPKCECGFDEAIKSHEQRKAGA